MNETVPPTIAAAVLLDAIELRCNWTRDDREAVEARCAAWALNNGRHAYDVADVRFITKTRAEALPRRRPSVELCTVNGTTFYGSPDCLAAPASELEQPCPCGATVNGEPASRHACGCSIDPEYADIDETGQLGLGVTGEQRALPGLARPRQED